MTDSELQAFVDAALLLEDAANETYTKFYDNMIGLAEGYGLDTLQTYGTGYKPTPSIKSQSQETRVVDGVTYVKTVGG